MFKPFLDREGFKCINKPASSTSYSITPEKGQKCVCVHPCKVCFQHSRLKLKLINTQNYCRVIWPWSYTFLKNIEDSSQLLAAVGVFFLSRVKGVCFWDFQCGLLDFFDATVCHLWWYMIIYRIWFSHTCTPVDAVDIDTAFIFSLILYMETEKNLQSVQEHSLSNWWIIPSSKSSSFTLLPDCLFDKEEATL